MIERIIIIGLLIVCCFQYGLSQIAEMQGDTTEFKMIDSIGHKRIQLSVKGNNSGITAFTPTGLSVAKLATTSGGFSGKLTLKNDKQGTGIAAHGGSESAKVSPNIKMKGKSSNITMSEEDNTQRIKLSFDESKAGFEIANPSGKSVAALKTSDDGKSGKLLLEDDNQKSTILIQGGSAMEASIPSVTITADSSVIVMKGEDEKERVRLFVNEDKSGFVASNSKGESVAQMTTTENGKSGILALENEGQVPTIFAQGGGASAGAIPLIRISGDSSMFQMRNKSFTERTRLFIEDDKSGIVVSNLEGESVAQMITTLDGLSGLMVLENDSQKATIYAQGGSSDLGLNPMVRITGDSVNLFLNNSNDIQRSKLFVSDEESGLSVSDLVGNPIAEIKTTEYGNSGMLSLKDDNQKTTILVEGGSDAMGTDPLIQMKGDFTKLVMGQESDFERIRLFVDDLKSGFVVSNSEGESVAQVITSDDGDFGIFALENDKQEPTIFASGGSRFEDFHPELRLSGENTKLNFASNAVAKLSLQVTDDQPVLSMVDGNGDELLKLSSGINEGYGEVFLSGENGMPNIVSSVTTVSDNLGFIGVYNEVGQRKVGMYATLEGHGEIHLRGANGNSNIFMSQAGDANRPYLHLANTAGSGRAGALIDAADKGFIFSEKFALLNPSNAEVASIFINGSGNSEVNAHTVSATVKNFRIDHPSQPDKEIWYASIEGPEAAAYVRGTGSLVDGEATIHLPGYFSEIVELEGMTILLTPLSGKSKGMAVIQKNVDQFSVVELLEGSGSYQFDWEVKGVRSGLEDFKVVRDKPKQSKNNVQNKLGKSDRKGRLIYNQKMNQGDSIKAH